MSETKPKLTLVVSDDKGQTPQDDSYADELLRRAQENGRKTSFVPAFETDKDALISPSALNPDYSSPLYRETDLITVFLEPGHPMAARNGRMSVDEAYYQEDERVLQQFGYDAYTDAANRARELVKNANTARFYEEMLRILRKQPELQLVHILTGVDKSSGYSTRMFGTIDPSQPYADSVAQTSEQTQPSAQPEATGLVRRFRNIARRIRPQ